MARYHLTKIELAVLGDHGHLSADDECYHYGEYTAGGGYGESDTNQLIFNLKWTPKDYWKNKAKQVVADHIAGITNLGDFTFVPDPPSKAKGDPEYDDRLMDILRMVKAQKPEFDVREIVTQKMSMEAAHKAGIRPTPAELMANYQVDQALLDGARKNIIIFDDIITAGAHYRAMTDFLIPHRKGLHFKGLFVARRVPKNPFAD